MKAVSALLQLHPHAPAEKRLDAWVEALDGLALCAQACLLCADACLAEDEPAALRDCIRLNLGCAEVCRATEGLLLRPTSASASVQQAQLHACISACQLCADQCEDHGRHHEHCAVCAEVCRRCQEKCNVLLGEISASATVGSE